MVVAKMPPDAASSHNEIELEAQEADGRAWMLIVDALLLLAVSASLCAGDDACYSEAEALMMPPPYPLRLLLNHAEGEAADPGQAVPHSNEVHTMEIGEWLFNLTSKSALSLVLYIQAYKVSFNDKKGKMKEAWQLRLVFLYTALAWLFYEGFLQAPWLFSLIPHWWRIVEAYHILASVIFARTIIYFIYLSIKTDMTSDMSCNKKEVEKWENKCTVFLYMASTTYVISYGLMIITNMNIFYRIAWIAWLCICGLMFFALLAMNKIQKKIYTLVQKTVSVRVKGSQAQSSKTGSNGKYLPIAPDRKSSSFSIDTEEFGEVPLNSNEARMFKLSKNVKKKMKILSAVLFVVTSYVITKLLPPYDFNESVVESTYNFSEFNFSFTPTVVVLALLYVTYYGWKEITWKDGK